MSSHEYNDDGDRIIPVAVSTADSDDDDIVIAALELLDYQPNMFRLWDERHGPGNNNAIIIVVEMSDDEKPFPESAGQMRATDFECAVMTYAIRRGWVAAVNGPRVTIDLNPMTSDDVASIARQLCFGVRS